MVRRGVGRRMVRTAAVGGAAYMVGSHAARSSMERQQAEADQNAQIAELQQQQSAMAQVQQAAPPQYAPPQYAPPPPPPAPAPAPATVAEPPARDPMEMLKQLGELKAAGVLTDEEFEVKKAELLKQI